MRVNVLIDSSVWIEYFADGNKAEIAARFVQKANKRFFKTPSIVVFEVYKKIKSELSEQAANQAIAHILDSTEIIPLDERIAIHAAETSLKTGLAMADSIIKATAELNNAGIKTTDTHFKGMQDIEII